MAAADEHCIYFAPITTEDHAVYLTTLIGDHHHEFCKLYPDATIIPKMHFYATYAKIDDQVCVINVITTVLRYVINFCRFGPLVYHWTMRFEAKHSYFKQLAHSMGNFVNVPYSLAVRHQLYQCYLNLNTEELPGWTHDFEAGPGQNIHHAFELCFEPCGFGKAKSIEIYLCIIHVMPLYLVLS